MKIHGFRSFPSNQSMVFFEETGAVATKVQFQRRGAMLAARQRRGARKVRETVEVFGSIGSPSYDICITLYGSLLIYKYSVYVHPNLMVDHYPITLW